MRRQQLLATWLKAKMQQAAIKAGIDRGLAIEGVDGVLIIYKGKVGTAGKIPEIIKVEIISPFEGRRGRDQTP